LNKKNEPVSWQEVNDFLSPKVAALLFVNSQVSALQPLRKYHVPARQIGRHVGAAEKFFGVSSLLSVHMFLYINMY